MSLTKREAAKENTDSDDDEEPRLGIKELSFRNFAGFGLMNDEGRSYGVLLARLYSI